MKTHETLKRICDMIGYKIKLPYIYNNQLGFRIIEGEYYGMNGFNTEKSFNEREIIFTPEFMGKFINYIIEKDLLTSSIEEHNIYYHLMKFNLENPTQYLYNLLPKK